MLFAHFFGCFLAKVWLCPLNISTIFFFSARDTRETSSILIYVWICVFCQFSVIQKTNKAKFIISVFFTSLKLIHTSLLSPVLYSSPLLIVRTLMLHIYSVSERIGLLHTKLFAKNNIMNKNLNSLKPLLGRGKTDKICL